MVIERVYGLQATGISINDRFTMIAAQEAQKQPVRPRSRLYYLLRNRILQRQLNLGIWRQNRAKANAGAPQRKQVARRSRPFLRQRGCGRTNYAAGQQQHQNQSQGRQQVAQRGRPFLRGRGVGRGGARRNPVSREQLDKELEQYMSMSRVVLDRQLDEYMAEATVDIQIG